MGDIRRRRWDTAVWIPLRRNETLANEGDDSTVGSLEEFDGVGAVVIYPEFRELVEARLGWQDLGLIDTKSYASKDHPYKPADVVWYNDGQPIGFSLVLVHRVSGDHPNQWIVHPDLVIALGLLQEGDSLLKVDEGYVEVIRQRRNAVGEVVAIEIKSDFLRDYLCARGLALRLVQFHQRSEIVENIDHLSWGENGAEIEEPFERLSLKIHAIGPDGGPPGAGLAVFKTWRTDVDPEQDAQVFGAETNENTGYEARTFVQPGGRVGYRVTGELWREAWIEPSDHSVRVRGDKPGDGLRYVVDAAGTTMTATELNREDIGRWLYFRPQVIGVLLSYRGSALSWYTESTGSVQCSPNEGVHFGIDAAGLVNVYAEDIANKAQWQQQVWFGHNVAPAGPACAELLDAQMRCEPAKTEAPENYFQRMLEALDGAFVKLHGSPLFHDHPDKAGMLDTIHRFRGLNGRAGVLSLAKDIARATADAIDVARMRELVPPGTKPGLGSLKLLDAYLAAKVGDVKSREIMGPLVGVYDLRLGDAHPASSSIDGAFKLARVDLDADGVEQCKQLLRSTALALQAILEAVCQPAAAS
ncbi:hypothetical protein BVV00_13615 [Serratia sp. OMLW3]|nr:hypothetical protein BVV00_13615 [Serratia sp. OMLW3]PIJ15851.1 hypothetical protein BVU99_13960 [Serratia sp. OLAL2]